MDIMEFKYWVLFGCLGVMMVVLRWIFNFATGELVAKFKEMITSINSLTKELLIIVERLKTGDETMDELRTDVNKIKDEVKNIEINCAKCKKQ